MKINKIIKQRSPQENLSVLIKNLVTYLNLQISFSAIDEAIENYKKCYSQNLNDLFKEWNINCELKNANISELSRQKEPFIAIMGPNQNVYVLVLHAENEHITYIDNEKGVVKENIYIFEQIWSGRFYSIEINPKSGEEDYKESIKNERRLFYKRILSFVPLMVILPLLYVSGIKFSNNNLSWLFFLFFQVIGTYCSIMLLSLKFDHWIKIPFFLQKVLFKTEALNQNISDYSIKRFTRITEALFFYFIGGLIFVIFGIVSNQLPSVLLILSAITYIFLPISVYNLLNKNKYPPLFYYTNIIILIECFCGAFSISNSFESNIQLWLSLIISYLVPFLVWNSIKQLINRNIEMAKELESLKYFKNPPMLWLLFNRSQYISIPRIKKELFYGNSNSNIQVTLFISPTHLLSNYYYLYLKEIAQRHDNIRLTIRFSFSTNYFSNYITELVLTYAAFNSSQSTLDLLEKWFLNNSKDTAFWTEKCNIYNGQDPQVCELIEEHKFFSSKIEYPLPIILINNRRVPDFFEAEDIEYLIVNHPAKNQTTTTTVKDKFWEDRRPVIL